MKIKKWTARTAIVSVSSGVHDKEWERKGPVERAGSGSAVVYTMQALCRHSEANRSHTSSLCGPGGFVKLSKRWGRNMPTVFLIPLIFDLTCKRACYRLPLCRFVYARDLMAVLYLLQLDKAANDATQKKRAFHEIRKRLRSFRWISSRMGNKRRGRRETPADKLALKGWCQSNCSVGRDWTFTTREVKRVKLLSCDCDESHLADSPQEHLHDLCIWQRPEVVSN